MIPALPMWLLATVAWGLILVAALAAGWFLLWAGGVAAAHLAAHLGYWATFLRWARDDIDRRDVLKVQRRRAKAGMTCAARPLPTPGVGPCDRPAHHDGPHGSGEFTWVERYGPTPPKRREDGEVDGEAGDAA